MGVKVINYFEQDELEVFVDVQEEMMLESYERGQN